ncbi:MAG: transcription antitermination factor NusB [Betaproteobacteria bacterium]|nr:MAG: transcription antitermination factor NusB [Betaproteobacteria bacterium]
MLPTEHDAAEPAVTERVEIGANAQPAKRSGGSRRLSRELVLRALYQWQLNESTLAELVAQAAATDIHAKANVTHFETLLAGILKHAATLDETLAPLLDREAAALSPIEHGVLLLGAYELIHQLDVPYRVVLNEAVDLTKRYGGTDGHKYINGVLDKLSRVVREAERGG